MAQILRSVVGRLLGLDNYGRLLNGGKFAGAADPMRVPVLAYSNAAASAAITNSMAETAFSTSYSIPAGSLQPGEVIKVTFQGIATATNATDTLLIRLRIGGLTGTVLLAGTATDVANNNIFAGQARIVVRTVGANGTFVAFGTHTEAPAASGTAVMDIVESTGSTAIDTTAAQSIVATATWSVANAGNSSRIDVFTVERA